jgi:DNA-binding MarR family transcriptional regulator
VDESRGAALARLLLGGFTTMVDQVIVELEHHGHPGVTATHEFALTAIDAGAQSASALGRELQVSKQAAAKSIAALEELGYLHRRTDPDDARRKILVVSPRGHEMMAIGARAFDELRSKLVAQVGAERMEIVESVLTTLGAVSETSPARPGSGTE